MRYLLCLFIAGFLLVPQPSQASVGQSYLSYVQDRTVLVTKVCKDKSKSGSGTGTIVDGDKVLTAEHVVDDREDCQIFVRREKEKSYLALVVKEDSKVDLALLVVSKNYGLSTEVAPARLGEEIVVIGYPAQLLDWGTPYLSALFGNVSTRNIKTKGRCVDRISAAIYYGNSGGAVFNSVGQIVGVVISGHLDTQGYFYMATGEDIQRFLGAK